MATKFNVTATADKQAYNPGDKITIRISGNASADATSQTVTADIILHGADGSLGAISVPVTLTKPGSDVEVTIASASDGTGRVWKVATDGKSVTATA